MKTILGHKMILASAGSGKTHTLVNRFIRLLVYGVEPSRINALTFTRKAAGEFLQKIFLRLCLAAGDENEAKSLSGQIEHPEGNCALYRSVLSRLVHDMGDLQLGTIDSFFARVVGAFPYELGLTRPHRIMNDFEQNVSRLQAIDRLFAFGDEDRSLLILQLYKEMTWGAEEKRVYPLFEDKLKDYHTLYLEARDIGLWGEAGKIFPERPWWMGPEVELSGLLEKIRLETSTLELKKSQVNAFVRLLDNFTGWQPGLPLNAGTFFESLLKNRSELAAGAVSIKVGQTTLDIESPLAGLLYQLLQTFVRKEVARRLVITHSLGALIAEYDKLYEQSIREAGSLVFADMPMLLIKSLCEGGAAFGSEDIVYRLDGQTDHWLVDEFQDTSRIQWKVLSAFIDEILQDPSGERTFFYVGDIKQSIYRWRGGDSRLFDEIYHRYAGADPGIEKDVLSQSWRSAPPVLECVNRLFGKGITASLGGGAVADRWNGLWQEHVASPVTSRLPGHAAWGLLYSDSSIEAGCIELITTIDPISNGLSCAILMRTNPEVAAMTQALREAGIQASMEGEVEIAKDNLLGTWMRAFFYAMARPDESFPRAFLGCAGFPIEGDLYPRLAADIRRAITEDGYAEAVRRIIAFVLPKLSPDPFLNRRSEQLLEAATSFENTGAQALEQFIAFMESAKVSESTIGSQVQVMTVHKAKGLDFDMVVVAGFGGEPLVRPNNRGLHVERESSGELNWILDLPNKLALEQEPILLKADSAEHDLNTFEALCLLYVAMTRARMGLYCLSNTPSRNSKALTWHELFTESFGITPEPRKEGSIAWQAEWGIADWHSRVERAAQKVAQPVRLKLIDKPLPPVRPNLRRAASPSEESHAEISVAPTLRSNIGRRFGTRMHDFLATIEWISIEDSPAVDKLLQSAEPDLQTRIEALLKSKLGREVFGKPSNPVNLWRERPYILRKQSTVATGIIDRAIVHLDESGKPLNATIYDFKTDILDPARPAAEQLMERYHLQLERYREAVSLLTGLPLKAVATTLVPV